MRGFIENLGDCDRCHTNTPNLTGLNSKISKTHRRSSMANDKPQKEKPEGGKDKGSSKPGKPDAQPQGGGGGNKPFPK